MSSLEAGLTGLTLTRQARSWACASGWLLDKTDALQTVQILQTGTGRLPLNVCCNEWLGAYKRAQEYHSMQEDSGQPNRRYCGRENGEIDPGHLLHFLKLYRCLW